MAAQNGFMKISNKFIAAILKSPFHGWMSSSTLLISVKGRKTGKIITTPVNYARSGQELLMISNSDRSWWKNIRENRDVVILLERREVHCSARVIETGDQLISSMEKYFTVFPQSAKYLKIQRNADGSFDRKAMELAAADRVVITCQLPA